MSIREHRDLLATLTSILGPERVVTDPEAQRRHLYDRDFALYSPLLATALAGLDVAVVVRPAGVEELTAVVAAAVDHRVPITVRGAGTGNYGQSLPLEGGLLIDTRGMDRVLEVTEEEVTVEAGAVLSRAEAAARRQGREIRVLPSTYRVSTAAGYVAGGSGGLGSITYGRLWDDNVRWVELLTAEDPPQLLRLDGPDARAAIHTYGVVGIITRAALALAPARPWREAVATFDRFETAARFAIAVASDPAIPKRLCSLQEAPIPTFFDPVKHLFTDRDAAVLLMVDAGGLERTEELAARFGGTLRPWPERPPISQFPFSHTILWSKKHDPASSWLQLRFAPDRFFEQVDAMRDRFGPVILQHVELIAGPAGVEFDGISVVRDAAPPVVDAIIRYCEAIGVQVLNPHSYVVEEGGMVTDLAQVLALKRRTDPYGLLNPGKIGRTFYQKQIAHV
ncbi:MAG TPA: FAD-binding oxidoreductase [Dehalococcoidia bacterium]